MAVAVVSGSLAYVYLQVPKETRFKTEEEHCIYVWLDALTNYYTAAVERQKDPSTHLCRPKAHRSDPPPQG